MSHPSRRRSQGDVLAEYPAVADRLTGGEFRPTPSGLSFKCPFNDRHKHGDRHWSARLWVGSRGELVCRCLGCRAGFGEFVSLSGLPPQSFWPAETHWGKPVTAPPTPPPKPVARYVYRHADGTEYGTKTRFEPGGHGRAKSFGWSRPVPGDLRQLCGIPDGHPAVIDGKQAMAGGWFVASKWADGWHLRRTEEAGAEGAVLVPDAPLPPLYRLPELLAADPSRLVFVVEGEKAADQLAALGLVATCPPNGANTWLPEYAAHFARREVVLCPDADHPGRALMQQAAGELLFRLSAASVRLLDAGCDGYELGDGGDVADWLASHRGRKAGEVKRLLWAAVQSAPLFRREVPRAA